MAKAKAKAVEVEEINQEVVVSLEDAKEKVVEKAVEDSKELSKEEEFIKEYAEKSAEFNTIFDEEIFVIAGELLAKINKVSTEIRGIKDRRKNYNIKNLELLVLKETRDIKIPKLKDGEKQTLVKMLQTIMKMKR